MQEANEKVSVQEEKVEPIDQLRIGPNLTCEKDHHFVYQTGTEVRCTKCPIGYPISPGTECRNGHLYIHGELVI